MSLTDAPIFSELTTESTRIKLITHQHEIEGNIYLPRAMKENRRLTNLLNSEKRFLAITQVSLKERATGATATYPYIQVNMAAIEMILPLD